MTLQVFKNSQFGEVRVINKDNQAWFCLVDVCKILDISNSRDVKSRLNPRGVDTTDTLTNGGTQKITIINESNLYKTIFQSRKSEAEQFTEWVTSEVLPDIRKHGLYMTDNLLEKTINDPSFLIKILEEYKQEKEKVKMLVHAGKLYTSTEIAKELGFNSAMVLNKDLEDKKIQYKVNKTWVLVSKYADKKYTSIKEFVKDNGKVIYDRKWTGLGREFLLNLYKEES